MLSGLKMHRLLLILALLTFGCEKATPPTSVESPVVTDELVKPVEPFEPVANPEPVAPLAIPTTAETASGPWDSSASLTAWKAELQSALDKGEWDAATALLKKMDPDVGAKFLENPESQKVESFEGQLDAEEPKEVVIQVRQHGEMEGTGEHEDFYWIGVIGEVAGKRKLLGTHVRPLLNVCEFADRPALTLGFSSKTPGPKAALWVVEQDVQSCGMLVEVNYKKVEYRVEAGKLVSKTLSGPASVEFDRSAGEEE